MSSRVLKTGDNQITQSYQQHYNKVVVQKAGWAIGVDVVKKTNSLDYIVAHTSGTVVKVVNYLDGTNGKLDNEAMGYGNYVMIKHSNNVYTLYAHLEKVTVKEGQGVTRGVTLGYMGNTGNSFGAHLHFEVRKYTATPTKATLHDNTKFEFLNSELYINADLPYQSSSTPTEDYTKNTIPNRFKVMVSGVQKGAYTSYTSACSQADVLKGYVVDGTTGKTIYTYKVVLTATSYPDYSAESGKAYRVRKSYNDGATSKGSFRIWKSAFNTWSANKAAGYHVYDATGKQLD